jgi:tRNA(fMet)-specific endonuclease VapC
VTVEEALRDRLAVLSRQRGGPAMVLAYERLVNTVSLLWQFPVAAFDAACEARYQQLRAMRLRVGTQDLKIAAVALVHNLTLVTRNRRDFGLIPGLVMDDWSV